MILSNKVWEVQSELAIDVGFTSFTLQQGDYFIFGDTHIKSIHYKIYGELQELKLNQDKIRTRTSVRLGNSSNWVSMSSCIGKEIVNITKVFNRDKLLSEILK